LTVIISTNIGDNTHVAAGTAEAVARFQSTFQYRTAASAIGAGCSGQPFSVAGFATWAGCATATAQQPDVAFWSPYIHYP
jgi:hypothetical protein